MGRSSFSADFFSTKNHVSTGQSMAKSAKHFHHPLNCKISIHEYFAHSHFLFIMLLLFNRIVKISSSACNIVFIFLHSEKCLYNHHNMTPEKIEKVHRFYNGIRLCVLLLIIIIAIVFALKIGITNLTMTLVLVKKQTLSFWIIKQNVIC